MAIYFREALFGVVLQITLAEFETISYMILLEKLLPCMKKFQMTMSIHPLNMVNDGILVPIWRFYQRNVFYSNDHRPFTSYVKKWHFAENLNFLPKTMYLPLKIIYEKSYMK